MKCDPDAPFWYLDWLAVVGLTLGSMIGMVLSYWLFSPIWRAIFPACW